MMHRRIIGSAVALTLLALAGCANGPAPSGPAAQSVPYVYRLAPDDKIRITVYGEPELTGQFLVGSDGTVAMPLIGSVRAAGLTVPQFEAGLTSQLNAKYLKHPRVSAEIAEYRPFYILGEVNRAGQYPYRVGMTVLDAVATAGGFTYRANQKSVAIKHRAEVGERRERLTADLQVRPGDTVRVLERFF